MNLEIESKQYVLRLFDERLSKNLYFHCLNHTKKVVKAAEIIGSASDLDNESMTILLTAAWFHDVGHTRKYTNHEEESQKIASNMLTKWGVSANKIEKIKSCIRATKLPQQPKTDLEKIICDADMFHLGQENYWEDNELLRNELSALFKKEIPIEEWYEGNHKFLKQHEYFTDYCKKHLEPIKQIHIEENRQKLKNKKSYC